MADQPALFVSHGAPDLPLTRHPARPALDALGAGLARPDGIIVVSAHFAAAVVTVDDARQHRVLHDFAGFASQLHTLDYPAPGSARLARRTREALRAGGLPPAVSFDRGLDHGAWVPLRLLFPNADIPVIQVSLLAGRDPEEQRRLGLALAALRRENLLILASGAATHNLYRLRPEGTPPETWAVEFDTWLADAVSRGDRQALLGWRQAAPHAAMAHPTAEHFDPLLVAFGAGGEAAGRVLHRSFSYGNLALAIYAFGSSTGAIHASAST